MNVYFYRNNDRVLISHEPHLPDQEPELSMPQDEFDALGGVARIVDDQLVIGYTQREQIRNELAKVDCELDYVDSRGGPRSLRAMILAVADLLPDTVSFDTEKLRTLETEAAALRTQRAELTQRLQALQES